jgi:hypothetical protein
MAFLTVKFVIDTAKKVGEFGSPAKKRVILD